MISSEYNVNDTPIEEDDEESKSESYCSEANFGNYDEETDQKDLPKNLEHIGLLLSLNIKHKLTKQSCV